MKKLKQFSLLVVFCTTLAISTKFATNQVKIGNAWVAITYEMAEDGYSNGQVAAVGAYGVLHAAMEGAIWGSVFGGPAGAIAGIAWGL